MTLNGTVRAAVAEESGALSDIAREAKAHWGYPKSAMAAWAPDLAVSAESVARRPTFVCEIEGVPAGFYQLATEDGAWELDHLWVRPDFMGHGVGRLLLAHAVEHARRGGARCIAIDADPNAEKFYLACGAVRTGVVAAPVEGEPERVRPQLRISLAETSS